MQNESLLPVEKEVKRGRPAADNTNELVERIERLEKCIAHMAAMNGTAGVLPVYGLKKHKVQ